MKNIVYVSESEVLIDGQKFVREEAKQPEFKVGMWIIGDLPCMLPSMPCRIISINGTRIEYVYDHNGEKEEQSIGIRPATPAEIEAHLKKICAKKGLLKPGQRYLSAGNKTPFVYDKYSSLYYDIKCDALYNKGMSVYSEGKFAEIIPDKKKYPKTRDEFHTFINEVINWYDSEDKPATQIEFLDQYSEE